MSRVLYKATDGSWRSADSGTGTSPLYRLKAGERWTLLDDDRVMVVHPDLSLASGTFSVSCQIGSSVTPRPPELLPIQLVRCAVIARGRPIPRLVPVAVIRVWVSAVVSVSVRHAPSPPIRVPSSTAATRDLHNGGVLSHTEAGNHRCGGPCIRHGHQAERRYDGRGC
jgi:hypothetical protein